ncbi:hypothetical protein [Phytohabitans kaempferiae]|uniref:Uncharacterized protein n=1 Tax=Phytohabitans kaempferiae TaxID=1620943 RepID=A0ABV6M4U1_9ACTN
MERRRLLEVLEGYREAVRVRQQALRAQLAVAEEFDTTLAGHIDVLTEPTRPRAAATS